MVLILSGQSCPFALKVLHNERERAWDEQMEVNYLMKKRGSVFMFTVHCLMEMEVWRKGKQAGTKGL